MLEKRFKNRYFCAFPVIFWVFLSIFSSLCSGIELDKSKYITIDEVEPGMEAYCLTVYKNTEVEKFALEVLSVVRNYSPGKDAIIVMGTDERFIHTGPVHGCSGSPVYIDGRLAGALAFGWQGSKDPLYGVTPIEEMLRAGTILNSRTLSEQSGFSFDYSVPLDFAEIDRELKADLAVRQNQAGQISTLPSLLAVSGMSGAAYGKLKDMLGPLGFVPVVGGSAIGEDDITKDIELVAGASLVVPLVTGDIEMSAIGTVTEVIDGKVYGFGHSFLGYGPVELPMATGQIHAVVSHLTSSFKLGSMVKTVGALTADESTAVYGQIGAEARMIPLTIRVERYNDTEKRVYNCQVVDNRTLTPVVFGSAAAGAALMLGSLPPDNMVEYKVTIGVEGFESVSFENVSSAVGLSQMLIESMGSVAMLMNNPYQRIEISSIDIGFRLSARNIISRIWSVDVSDTKVKAGEQLEVTIVTESVRAGKKKYSYKLQIPQDTQTGEYSLNVMGGFAYRDFLKSNRPYKFIPRSVKTLIESLNGVLTIDKSKVYCVLVLPAAGVAVERGELPDLPATKALVLSDASRTLDTRPFSQWLEKTFEASAIVIDKKTIQITVEK